MRMLDYKSWCILSVTIAIIPLGKTACFVLRSLQLQYEKATRAAHDCVLVPGRSVRAGERRGPQLDHAERLHRHAAQLPARRPRHLLGQDLSRWRHCRYTATSRLTHGHSCFLHSKKYTLVLLSVKLTLLLHNLFKPIFFPF